MVKPIEVGDKYVEITLDGEEINIEVHGVKDGSCRTLTQGVERALGVVKARKATGPCLKTKSNLKTR